MTEVSQYEFTVLPMFVVLIFQANIYFWQEYEVRELLAQCEASEMDLQQQQQQQQQQLPSMPSLVPSISVAGPTADNLTSRRTKVCSYRCFACMNRITVHQCVSRRENP